MADENILDVGMKIPDLNCVGSGLRLIKFVKRPIAECRSSPRSIARRYLSSFVTVSNRPAEVGAGGPEGRSQGRKLPPRFYESGPIMLLCNRVEE
jgi:hypothetical protein